MSGAQQHYRALLGSVYTWSMSAAGDPSERAAAFLARHGLDGAERYLDLGAGFGAHALALARAGKHVTAVDFDPTLSAELRAATRTHAAQVEIHEGELLAFLRGAPSAGFDVILCLGDTLTHLDTIDAAAMLCREAARCLAPGGRLALSYRDSTGFAAQGVARFLEVARDANRSMHCLLEPLDAGHLRVTDLVTELTPDGPRTRISDYVKLRIAPATLVGWAGQAGLRELSRDEERGMLTLIFGRS